jgi:hypothetical protein
LTAKKLNTRYFCNIYSHLRLRSLQPDRRQSRADRDRPWFHRSRRSLFRRERRFSKPASADRFRQHFAAIITFYEKAHSLSAKQLGQLRNIRRNPPRLPAQSLRPTLQHARPLPDSRPHPGPASASLSPMNERVRVRLRFGAKQLRQLCDIGSNPPPQCEYSRTPASAPAYSQQSGSPRALRAVALRAPALYLATGPSDTRVATAESGRIHSVRDGALVQSTPVKWGTNVGWALYPLKHQLSTETKPPATRIAQPLRSYAAVAIALGIGWLLGRMHRPL